MYREFEAMQRGKDAAQAVRWALDSSVRFNWYLTMNAREFLDLFFLKEIAAHMRGSSIHDDLLATSGKIESTPGEMGFFALDEFRAEFYFLTRWGRISE